MAGFQSHDTLTRFGRKKIQKNRKILITRKKPGMLFSVAQLLAIDFYLIVSLCAPVPLGTLSDAIRTQRVLIQCRPENAKKTPKKARKFAKTHGVIHIRRSIENAHEHDCGPTLMRSRRSLANPTRLPRYLPRRILRFSAPECGGNPGCACRPPLLCSPRPR